MSANPIVTVLMPVYNGSAYLREAIESILNQTFQLFELLIIDDGSTDDSREIVNSFNDARIRLICQQCNQGLIKTLNLGLNLTRTPYLARMDADDVALPERLGKQVEFLQTHPEISCVGSDFIWLGNPNEKSWVNYFTPNEIKVALLFGCPLCHPTVMFRMEDIRRYSLSYSSDYLHAEDYAFWVEISQNLQIANLTETLLQYRKHAGQISKLKSDIQCRSIDKIQVDQLRKLGIEPTLADLMLNHVLGGAFIPIPFLSYLLQHWCLHILEANRKIHYFPQEVLKQQLERRVISSVSFTKILLKQMSPIRKLHWYITSTWRYWLHH